MSVRAGLLASAITAMIREDPTLLVAQVSRRYLPSELREILGRAAGHLPGALGPLPLTAVRHALALLADRPDLFAERGVSSLRGEARRLWDMGDVPGALALLDPDDSLARRLAEEWRLLGAPRLHLPTAADNSPHYRARPNALSLPAAENPAHVDVLHFLNNSAPYTQSGYTVRTARLLEAQAAAGLKVAAATRIGYPVITGSWRVPDSSIVGGIEYHRLLPTSLERMPADRLTQQASMLQDLARRLAPRVLHTTTDFRNAVVVEAVARSLGIPWVYEMRGQLEKSWVARHVLERQDAVVNSPRYRAWRDAETEMARRADAVLVLSHTQLEDMRERGIQPEKMAILPNAFDMPEGITLRSREEARAELGLPGKRLWVGSVSAVVDYEGFETLIRAVAKRRSEGDDVGAMIVGDGVSLPGLRELARHLGISDHVVLPGRVPVEESHLWYQALDAFAVPRKDTPVCRSVTPIKPLEAMALGTPVLVSDLPALREIIGEGAGFAVAPEDAEAWAAALATTQPDSTEYVTMSHMARQRAELFSWAHGARTCSDVYARILR